MLFKREMELIDHWSPLLWFKEFYFIKNTNGYFFKPEDSSASWWSVCAKPCVGAGSPCFFSSSICSSFRSSWSVRREAESRAALASSKFNCWRKAKPVKGTGLKKIFKNGRVTLLGTVNVVDFLLFGIICITKYSEGLDIQRQRKWKDVNTLKTNGGWEHAGVEHREEYEET